MTNFVKNSFVFNKVLVFFSSQLLVGHTKSWIPTNTSEYQNTTEYCWIPLNTAEYHRIPLNTTEYHWIPIHTNINEWKWTFWDIFTFLGKIGDRFQFWKTTNPFWALFFAWNDFFKSWKSKRVVRFLISCIFDPILLGPNLQKRPYAQKIFFYKNSSIFAIDSWN